MDEALTPINPAQVPSDPQSNSQQPALETEMPPIDLVPETVDDAIQSPPPQDPPPVIMQHTKPPLILVAASLGIITLFIIGLLIVALNKKNTHTASAKPASSTTTLSPPVKPAQKKQGLSTTYLSPEKDYTFAYPVGFDAVFDTEEPYIGFCGIGKAEMSVTFSKKNEPGAKLTISVAKKEFKDLSPEFWVKENCTPLLEDRVTLGLIKEEGVEGASYGIPFTEGEFGALAYNLTVIKKNSFLYFIYASGTSDEIMKSVFDPLLTSFTLKP